MHTQIDRDSSVGLDAVVYTDRETSEVIDPSTHRDSSVGLDTGAHTQINRDRNVCIDTGVRTDSQGHQFGYRYRCAHT